MRRLNVTRRGEGRIADKVRSLLESRGFIIDFFWFQSPFYLEKGGARWGAYGSKNGRPVDFFSWDKMIDVARMKRPALGTDYSERANGFEVFACEEAADV